MNESNELTPFLGSGTWLDRVGNESRTPLVTWVVRHGLVLPADYLGVLARCDSAAEARFIIPLVSMSDWTTAGVDGFTNGEMRVTIQESVGPYRVDFVFRSAFLGRPLAVEIDGPSHDEPTAGLRDRARQMTVEAHGFQVRRVRAEVAQEAGWALRREIGKLQLARLPTVGRRSKQLARSRRAWNANPLAYGVAGLPSIQRKELLSSWLASRGIVVARAMEEFLATCDDAAEVNFLLPFVELSDAYTDGEEFLGIGPYWILVGQNDDKGRMDVVLGWDVDEGVEVLVFDIEPPPYVAFDGWQAELKRRNWRQRGFIPIRVGAKRAAAEGRWWANRVRQGTQCYLRAGEVWPLSSFVPN